MSLSEVFLSTDILERVRLVTESSSRHYENVLKCRIWTRWLMSEEMYFYGSNSLLEMSTFSVVFVFKDILVVNVLIVRFYCDGIAICLKKKHGHG